MTYTIFTCCHVFIFDEDKTNAEKMADFKFCRRPFQFLTIGTIGVDSQEFQRPMSPHDIHQAREHLLSLK
jgi:hypothetical protein